MKVELERFITGNAGWYLIVEGKTVAVLLPSDIRQIVETHYVQFESLDHTRRVVTQYYAEKAAAK